MVWIPTKEEREADERAKREAEVSEHERMFNLPDDALVIKAENRMEATKIDYKIDSICNYWHEKRRLSDKQKWCLAFYVAYGSSEKPQAKSESKSANSYKPFEPYSYDDKDDDIPF